MIVEYGYLECQDLDWLCEGCDNWFTSMNRYTWLSKAITTERRQSLHLCQECSSDLMETILQNCRDTNRKEDVK